MKYLFNEQRLAAIRATFPDNAAVRRLFVTNEGEKPLAQRSWRNLVSVRHELGEATRTLLASIEAQKREATESELAAFDAVNAVIDLYRAEMNFRTELGERGPRDPQSRAPEAADSAGRREGIWFRDVDTGREIRAYRHGESMAQDMRADSLLGDLTLGKVLRGLAVGKWDSKDQQQRALSLGTSSAGGYTVPAPLAAQFVDLARNRIVCSQAGALMIPMPSNTFDLAKLTGDGTIDWRAENVAITASDPTFDRVRFTAKTAAVLFKASEELIQDSVNADAILEQAATDKFVAEMDRIMLVGSGSNDEPTGIRYASGVGTAFISGGGSLSNYDVFVDAIQDVRDSNFEPGAVVMAPRTAAQMAKLKDTTNQPLQPPADYAALRKLVTTGIPTDLASQSSPSFANTSIAIVGDYREAAWGVRLNPTFLVTREAGDNNGGAFSAYQIWIRMVMRVDVQLFRAGAFSVVLDIPS